MKKNYHHTINFQRTNSYELEILKKKKNLFTGHGPQADRHFLYNPQDISADSVVGPFDTHIKYLYL